MIGALALVVRRDWTRHRLRLILTAAGIALGGAVFFSIQAVNTALVSSLNTTLENLGGRSTLQVVAGESGFPLDIVDQVRKTPGVAVAEPVTETYATLPTGDRILILGLDTESKLWLYADTVDESSLIIKDPAAFENHPESIVVSSSFAARRNLKDGDKLTVTTNSGEHTLTIRGVFESKGIGSVFDGNVAVMDLYAVEQLFARGKKIDRIDIGTADGANVDTVQAALSQKLGSGYDVVRPELRGKSLENSVTVLHAGFTIISLLGLTVSVFIIFNSFSISVTQRWKQIAILRAIGVEGRNVQLMFLGESAVLGVIGSILGVLAGLAIAAAALRVVLSATQTVYGFVASSPTISFSWTDAALTFGLGVISSVAGAWVPARSASHIKPALALRNVEVRSTTSHYRGARLVAGLAFIAAFWLLTVFSPPQIDGYGQMGYLTLMLLGMVLVLPTLLHLAARAARPVASRLFGVEGAIAVDNMSHAPRRTVATVAAIMLGLTFVLATSSFVASQKAAVNRSVDKAAAADMMVTSSSELHSRSIHFTAATADKVASLPGVDTADKVRITSAEIDGREVAIMAHTMGAFFRISPDVLDLGDPATASDATANGRGGLISNNMAYRFGFHIGDTLTLRSPKGDVSLPIVGMLDYFRSENGTVFIDRAVYQKYWDDSDVDYIFIKLKPGTDRQAFKQDVETALAGTQRAFIYTHEEYKAFVGQIIDQFFIMMYMQMIVAAIVAAIGLVNTMLISVAERTRELGTFRAIGGLRRQVVKMVVIEAAAIGVVGLVAGIAAGLMNAYFLVHNAAKVVAGFNLPLRFPDMMILVSVPLVIVIAVASAWFPAWKASRLRITEAIGYE